MLHDHQKSRVLMNTKLKKTWFWHGFPRPTWKDTRSRRRCPRTTGRKTLLHAPKYIESRLYIQKIIFKTGKVRQGKVKIHLEQFFSIGIQLVVYMIPDFWRQEKFAPEAQMLLTYSILPDLLNHWKGIERYSRKSVNIDRIPGWKRRPPITLGQWLKRRRD